MKKKKFLYKLLDIISKIEKYALFMILKKEKGRTTEGMELSDPEITWTLEIKENFGILDVEII